MTHAHRLCFAAVLLAIAACVLLPWSSVPVPAAPVGGSGDGATAPGFRGLDRLADGGLPITLELEDVPLERILEAIESRVPGLELRPGDDLVREQRASIDLSGVPLKVALTRLGLAAGLRYDVLDARTLIVHPVLLSGVDGVTRPTPIDKVEVAYPEALRAQGLTAEIVLQAVVEVDGSVTDVQVLRDSAPEHPEFAQSAVEAVSRWRYAPATLADGRPVPVYFTIFINFKLR